MTRFRSLLIRPNVTAQTSTAKELRVTEEACRRAADETDSILVRRSPSDDEIVGNVVDVRYEDGGGLVATVEIDDDRIGKLLEDDISLVPRIEEIEFEVESEQNIDDMTLHSVFPCPEPSENVGETAVVPPEQPLSLYVE